MMIFDHTPQNETGVDVGVRIGHWNKEGGDRNHILLSESKSNVLHVVAANDTRKIWGYNIM